MSYRIFSESDIKKIHSIIREADSEGNSCDVEPFDLTTLLSSIPTANRFVLEQVMQENAVVHFVAWLVFLLVKSNNDLNDLTSTTVCDTIGEQFSSFSGKLMGVPEISPETICFNITNWFEYTEELVDLIECFYHEDFVTKTGGWGSYSVFSIIFNSMRREKEHAYDEVADKYYGKVFCDVVLYNFWGDDFSSIKKRIDYRVPLTSDEKAMINNRENRQRLFYECECLFITGKSRMEPHHAPLLFEKLFKDYISRIREKIQIPAVLPFATHYWKTITQIIMGRLNSYGLSEEEMGGARFNSEDFLSCYHAVSDICGDYLEQLTPGSQYCTWSASLKELDISYNDLYKTMTTGDEKFFIPSSLSLEDFTRGFEEANIKPLYDSVEDYCKTNSKGKSGKLGCIKYIVSELGHQLGEEWFLKAAESICDKRGSKAKNYMRNHTDTLAIKSFSKVLHDIIPSLSYRDKVSRRKY